VLNHKPLALRFKGTGGRRNYRSVAWELGLGLFHAFSYPIHLIIVSPSVRFRGVAVCGVGHGAGVVGCRALLLLGVSLPFPTPQPPTTHSTLSDLCFFRGDSRAGGEVLLRWCRKQLLPFLSGHTAATFLSSPFVTKHVRQ